MENDSFYYNALIQNKDGSDTVIGPMVAAFAETRAIPILRDTTGWKVGLARLSTFGATLDLPLWEAPVIAGTNITPYVFTMTATTGILPTTFAITASNNTLVLATMTNFGTSFLALPTTLTIPVGAAYTSPLLATAITTSMVAGGFTNSVCSWSSTSSVFTLQVNPPSPYTPVSFVVTTANQTISVNILNTVGQSLTTSAFVALGTYTAAQLATAISTALTGTFNGVACLGTATLSPSTFPGASGSAQQMSIKFGPTISTSKVYCSIYGGGGQYASPLFKALGNTDILVQTFNMGTVLPFVLAAPQFGQSTGFVRDSSTLFSFMGYSSAAGYAAYPVTSSFNNTTGVLSATPLTSPNFLKTLSDLDATKYTLSASAPLIWKPQHVGNPKYALRCSSYQYVCRLVNDCFATIMESLNAQFRAVSVNPAAKLTTPIPTLQFQNGIYTLVLSPAFSSVPATEVFTLSQNLACSRWLPFPVLTSYDADVRVAQATIANPALTIPTVLLDTSGGYLLDNGTTLQSLLVSQEYDSTSNWCPYIGLTIVSSTIPANAEMSGLSYVNPSSYATPQIGEASATVLFDMDLSGDSAHSYLSGISFSPTLMRFNSLMGSPLGTIAFQVFLRRRDNTLDAWDVPTYGCVDLKLLFQYGN